MMKRVSLLSILLLLCVGCDQSTKYIARQGLEGRPAMSFLGDFFRLSYAENSGGFLSLGTGLPEHYRKMVFVVLVSLFLLGLTVYVIRNRELSVAAISACALIIGGGFGNLIDRILNQGAVVDFMNIGMGSIRSGIFNFADVAIMAGLFILAVNYPKLPKKDLKSYDT